MIGEMIGLLIRNLQVFLLLAAIVLAVSTSGHDTIIERHLAWTLLLPIGVTFGPDRPRLLPSTAAAHIGWQVSAFQFEVGMADLAIGITAYLAFWRDLSFRAAAVCAASIFLFGDAIGHVRDMIVAGNFAPGNAGVPFYMDILCPALAIMLVIIAIRRQTELGLKGKGKP